MQNLQTSELEHAEPKNYTDKEAAEFLRISPVSLWRLRKAGAIKYRRVGNRIIYTSRDLQNFLERNAQGGFAVAQSN